MIRIGDQAKVIESLRRFPNTQGILCWERLITLTSEFPAGGYTRIEMIERLADLIGKAVKEVPEAQLNDMKTRLGDLVDAYVSDPQDGDVVEGNVRSRLGWV